ncbi:MAG: NADH:ubiquinone reductase (Na(+)-transporting) subunit C [Planctomycetota bacterium]
MEFSNRYILLFSVIVCLVCALGVSATAVGLKEPQDRNQRLFKQENVLRAVGAITPDEKKVAPERVTKLFGQIRQVVIDQKSGSLLQEDPETVKPEKLAKDPEHSVLTPKELSGSVKRVPDKLLAYEVDIPGHEGIVLPIYGNGLWSTLYGYVALSPDGREVRGITYYQHGETPGLGGEVDNPVWKAQWPGKHIYDAQGAVKIDVVKFGTVSNPEFQVDGISGATITSRSVGAMLHVWLGELGYGPYLESKSK